VRVYIFRNDAESLHAYTQDISGQNLPISLTGVAWIQCGLVPRLEKLFPTAQAQVIADAVTSHGF